MIVLVIIIFVLGYGALKFGQGMYRVWRLTSMLETEEQALNEALERIDQLEKEIERLSNDLAYIEKLAREEYGMMKEGEEVYRLENGNDAKD